MMPRSRRYRAFPVPVATDKANGPVQPYGEGGPLISAVRTIAK
jgi:hypothetical protein